MGRNKQIMLSTISRKLVEFKHHKTLTQMPNWQNTRLPSIVAVLVLITISSVICICFLSTKNGQYNVHYEMDKFWNTLILESARETQAPTEAFTMTYYDDWDERKRNRNKGPKLKEEEGLWPTHCLLPSPLGGVVCAGVFIMLLMEAVAFTVFFTATRSQILEGEFCEDNGQTSVCKKLIECPTAQTAIRHGKRPKICGFDGILPIVCCPPSAEKDTTTFSEQWGTITSTESWNSVRPSTTKRYPNRHNSKSKQMCQKYAEYVYRFVESPSLLDSNVEKVNECAIIEETLIVGGTFASLNEFPHMVHIGYGEEPRIAYLCGGSLISERFVLSAAHCTKPRGLAKWALFGNVNLQNNRNFKQIILRIVRHYNHPDYDSVQLYNDIALFKLEKDVPLSPEIRPICLQTDFSFSSTSAIATGWGHVSWGGFSSDRLKKVTLNIVDTAVCNNSFRSSIGGSQLPNGILDETMICAGDEIGKDACQGDSGGPLQITLKKPYCMYSIIGITSFGKNCGESIPGVYTRVSHFIPWIESIVWP